MATLQDESAEITAPFISEAARGGVLHRSANGKIASRWIKEPTFQEELTRRRDEVLTEALATAKTHAARAMAHLAGLLEVADERLRRHVCNDMLGYAVKTRELEDLERRLVALEEAAKEQKKYRRHA